MITPNGLFNINKPAGMTSHDVVNAVRRLAGLRRVGHAGTLDPLATGVLLVMAGPSTRLAQFITGHDKSYQAVVRLGAVTTTYDAEGEIVESYPVPEGLSRTDLEAALVSFIGPQQQLPPRYSAIKVAGQPLYKLARRGEEIELTPRAVTITKITLLEWASPDLTIAVDCSAGTYIRSLAYDLGQALGCGAHLQALTRTRSGPFTLESSYPLDTLKELAAAGTLNQALLPPEAALHNLPPVLLNEEQEQAVSFGRTLYLPEAPATASHLQARNAAGRTIAVLVPDKEPGTWHPDLVLAES